MLAVRYCENGKEVFKDLSEGQYEQITDKDIHTMLGYHGVCLELRKMVNFFQSEEEFVESMSLPLEDGEAEIYLQDSFDEEDGDNSNDAYFVIRTKDIAKLFSQPIMKWNKPLYETAKNLDELVDVWVKSSERPVSCTFLILSVFCMPMFDLLHGVEKLKYIVNTVKTIMMAYDNNLIPMLADDKTFKEINSYLSKVGTW